MSRGKMHTVIEPGSLPNKPFKPSIEGRSSVLLQVLLPSCLGGVLHAGWRLDVRCTSLATRSPCRRGQWRRVGFRLWRQELCSKRCVNCQSWLVRHWRRSIPGIQCKLPACHLFRSFRQTVGSLVAVGVLQLRFSGFAGALGVTSMSPATTGL